MHKDGVDAGVAVVLTTWLARTEVAGSWVGVAEGSVTVGVIMILRVEVGLLTAVGEINVVTLSASAACVSASGSGCAAPCAPDEPSNTNPTSTTNRIANTATRIGITRRNDLPLFGEAKATVDTPRRLGTDGVIRRSAATRNGAATPVEDGQLDTILLRHGGDLLLCLI